MHVKYPIETHTLEIKDPTTLIHDVCNCTAYNISQKGKEQFTNMEKFQNIY